MLFAGFTWYHFFFKKKARNTKLTVCKRFYSHTKAWERIFATSGVVLNSMGDYFQCTHNTTSVLQERSGYQMCILDILDASGTYTTVTQVRIYQI